MRSVVKCCVFVVFNNNPMKIYLFFAILICLAAGIETISAQTAQPTPKPLIARLGVLNGKATTLIKPIYPAAAAKSGAAGVVIVDVTVDEKGNVVEAKSDYSSVLLRDAAITAARGSKFEPYTFQGKAVKVIGTLVFNFVAPKDDYFDMSGLGDFLEGDKRMTSILSVMEVPAKVEEGKYDEAIAILDPLIAKDPKYPWTLGYRALIYYYKNDLNRALADANAALATKPGETRALNVRALIERKRNQTDLANKDFDLAVAASNSAIAAHPGSMDDYFARAETYRLRGDNAKAAADYRKTLELSRGYQFAQAHLDLVTGKQPAPAQITISGETDAELKTKFVALIEKNNALGAVYDQKKTATMSLQASHVTGAKMCQALAEFSVAYNDLDPVLNDLINIRDKVASVATAKQLEGLKAVLKWRAETFLPNKEIINDMSASNGCQAATGAAPVSDNFKKFKAHFEEFNRLQPLFEAAGDKVDKLEESLKKDNAKNGRGMFTKPADNTAICMALSDIDTLYNKLFSEYYDMNEMKESGELAGRPDFIKFVEQSEEWIDGLGGDIMTRQMLWGCKTK